MANLGDSISHNPSRVNCRQMWWAGLFSPEIVAVVNDGSSSATRRGGSADASAFIVPNPRAGARPVSLKVTFLRVARNSGANPSRSSYDPDWYPASYGQTDILV